MRFQRIKTKDLPRQRFFAISALYLSTLAVLATIGYLYPTVSKGLAADGSQNPFFCDELQSSGGDDSAMIIAFFVFTLPLVYRLARIGRIPSRWELSVFWVCLAIVLFALWLATLDCADILYTAFEVPDYYLLAALGALPVAALSILVLARQESP